MVGGGALPSARRLDDEQLRMTDISFPIIGASLEAAYITGANGHCPFGSRAAWEVRCSHASSEFGFQRLWLSSWWSGRDRA